jgi:hypothetical protein
MNSRGALASAGPDRVLEVDAVLARLGLGRLAPATDLATFPGRNDNWSGRTDEGHRVFVKRFGGPEHSARERLRRSVGCGQLLARCPIEVAPRNLGWDEDARMLVSDFIADARSGADLAAGGQFGADLAFRAGSVIGSVHALPAGSLAPDSAAERRPPLPSAELLRGLPLPVFCECSAGELKAWRLMQQDEFLADAVGRLLAQEEQAARVAAHCDLRLDQFLLAAGRLYLTDWEEFRLADAARDVGSFAGEWLHRKVTGWADATAAEPPSHEEIVRHCTQGIEEARPAIAAFWSGYQQARPHHDRGLAGRAVAFAGWHLFDRMLAAARQSVRLSAVHRAAAGIGRTLMRDPAASAATIGLGPGS